MCLPLYSTEPLSIFGHFSLKKIKNKKRATTESQTKQVDSTKQMKHNVVPILDNGPLLFLILSEQTKKEHIILFGTSGHFQEVILVEVQVAVSCAAADRG